MSRPGLGAYARAVEQAWSQVRSSPSRISRKDFELVASWHARRIPLGVVVEVFVEMAQRGRGRGRASAATARTLAYFSPAVEAAWDALRSARASAPEPTTAIPDPGTLEAWRRVRDDRATPTALRVLLRELVRDAEAGGDLLAVDRRLDEELPATAPQAETARAAAEAASVLAATRRRMAPDAYRATLRRTAVDRLRRSLGLPRVGLTTGER